MEAQRLLDLALMFLVFVGPSIVTAVTPHPSKVQEPIVQALLLFLGRLSVLRHGAPEGDSPGTLHWPLTAQPAPRPQGLYLHSELRPLPPPAGPGTGPLMQRRRLTPAITWLAAPALGLVLLSAPGCNMTPQQRTETLRKVSAAFDLAGCAVSTAAAVPELVNVFSSGDIAGGIAGLLATNPFEKVMCAVNAIATMGSQAGATDTGRGGGAWAMLYARADDCRAKKVREQHCRPEGEAALYLVERARIARDLTVPAVPPPALAPPAPAAAPGTSPPAPPAPPAAPPMPAAPAAPSTALPRPPGGAM